MAMIRWKKPVIVATILIFVSLLPFLWPVNLAKVDNANSAIFVEMSKPRALLFLVLQPLSRMKMKKLVQDSGILDPRTCNVVAVSDSIYATDKDKFLEEHGVSNLEKFSAANLFLYRCATEKLYWGSGLSPDS